MVKGFQKKYSFFEAGDLRVHRAGGIEQGACVALAIEQIETALTTRTVAHQSHRSPGVRTSDIAVAVGLGDQLTLPAVSLVVPSGVVVAWILPLAFSILRT